MANNSRTDVLLEDNEIIELYWERDEEAISETDKKYGRYLFTIANNIVNNRLDSEECVNDTYLGTWNAIPPTRPNVFQVFLSKVMRNIAVDKFREKSAQKRIPSELMSSLDEISEVFDYDNTVEENEAVKTVIGVLNDYLRSVDNQKQLMFVCRYYYADKVKEIADMLGVSERTVFRTLAAMRDELAERLKKEGVSVE